MFSLDEDSMQGTACMDGIGCIAFVVELCEHCGVLLWHFLKEAAQVNVPT